MLLVAPALADSVGPLTQHVWMNPNVSDTYTLPISYHSTYAFTNWAGAIIDINFDTTEISFLGAVGRLPDGITPGAAGFTPTYSGMSGTYPPGYTVVSFWSNNAINSGTTPATTPLGASNTFPLGAVTFHFSGTIVDDGLADVTFTAWNIWHVTPDQSTASWSVPGSVWLYGPTPGVWEPTPPGQGVWWHNPATIVTHVTASMFWATQTWISGVGDLSVVPEPTSFGFVLAGLSAIALARRR
jgi:hypothetical protein